MRGSTWNNNNDIIGESVAHNIFVRHDRFFFFFFFAETHFSCRRARQNLRVATHCKHLFLRPFEQVWGKVKTRRVLDREYFGLKLFFSLSECFAAASDFRRAALARRRSFRPRTHWEALVIIPEEVKSTVGTCARQPFELPSCKSPYCLVLRRLMHCGDNRKNSSTPRIVRVIRQNSRKREFPWDFLDFRCLQSSRKKTLHL